MLSRRVAGTLVPPGSRWQSARPPFPGRPGPGYARRHRHICSALSAEAPCGFSAQARPSRRPSPPRARRQPPGLRASLALLTALAGGLALAAAFPPAGIWPLAAVGPAMLTIALWRQRGRVAFAVGVALRPGILLAAAVLAGQPGLVRLGRAGRRGVGDLRGARHRSVAAAAAAGLAARGRRLVGGRRGGARPVAVGRIPVGTAGDEPGDGTDRAVDRDRGTAVPDLPDRPLRRLPGLGCCWAQPSATAAPAVMGQGQALASAGAGGERGSWPSAVRLLPADQATRRRADRGRGGNPGRRPACQEPAGPLAGHHRHAESRSRHGTARGRGPQRRGTGTGCRHLAGELDRPGSRLQTRSSSTRSPPRWPQSTGLSWSVRCCRIPSATLASSGCRARARWPCTLKRRLVPFGEVIPFRSLISKITSLPSTLQPVNFTPGHRPVVFHLGKVRLGDVICYEVGFDGLVSSEVAAGANLLAMQTNDADFEIDGQTGEIAAAARHGPDPGYRARPLGRRRLHHWDQCRHRPGWPAADQHPHLDAGRDRGEGAVAQLDHAGRPARRLAGGGARLGHGRRPRLGHWPESGAAASAVRPAGRHIRPVAQHNRNVTFGRSLRQPVRYAALLSGAIPVLAFPAANLEFLGWIGLVPGLAVMRAAPSRREAVVRGWWFGAGYLLAAMYWLAPNLGPGLLLVAIVIGVPVECCRTGHLVLAAPAGHRPAGRGRVCVVPSCWLVSEWIRSWQGIGGPWAVLGASQWQHPAVLALAAVGGVWLVTFALVASNTGLLIALVASQPGSPAGWPGRGAGRHRGRPDRVRAGCAGASRQAADDRSGPARPDQRARRPAAAERAADSGPGWPG